MNISLNLQTNRVKRLLIVNYEAFNTGLVLMDSFNFHICNAR